MENTYHKEMTAAQNEAEKIKKELMLVNIENDKLKEQIKVLQKSLSNAVNEVYSLATTIEECSCGDNCGCKGTYLKDEEQLSP